MARYAAGTEVPIANSRAEIERTVTRYGADAFMSFWEANRAVIGFRARGRHIRFELKMPDANDKAFRYTSHSPPRPRTLAQVQEAIEQAKRQRWRALALVIKAKLEAVESGIAEFDEEFLAHIVLPDGQTVGKWMLPQVASAYATGDMPPLLPAPRKD